MSLLLIILIAAFVMVLTIVLGAFWTFVVRPETESKSSLQKRLQLGTTAPGRKIRKSHLEKADQQGDVAGLEALVRQSGRFGTHVAQLIKQSDVKLSLSGFFALSALVAALAYLIVFVLTSFHLLAIAAAALMATAPYFYVRHKRMQRLWKFEEQFPEAIDLIARALRAGHAFTTGVSMVADEIPEPVSTEFRLLYDRQNYGMPLDEAMRDFADRVPLIDARFFVTSVLMQRATGGNLAEVLDNLATVIRDRFQVKRQIRVSTAHGRITGWVLAGFPPALAMMMFINTPDHLRMMIEDPLGVQMIVGAAVLQIVGTLTIRKLVNVRY